MATLFYKTKHKYIPTGGNSPIGVSQTVQGEVKPIKEIIHRALNGMPPERRQAHYLDAGDLDYINQYYAPHALDLTDVDAFNRHVATLQKAAETMKAKKLAEEQQKAAETMKAKKLAEEQQKSNKPENGDNPE